MRALGVVAKRLDKIASGGLTTPLEWRDLPQHPAGRHGKSSTELGVEQVRCCTVLDAA